MKCNNCNKELNFPEGVIKQNRVLENFGEKAFFWLGDSNSKTNANCMILDRNQLMENSARKTMLYSVRYILD